MYLQIDPIPFGFRVLATKVNLVWISKPLFSEELTLRVEFYTQAEQNLDYIDLPMTTVEYTAKGTDKWTRAVQILKEQDIVVISTREEIYPVAGPDESEIV